MKIVPVLTTGGVWLKYDNKKHLKYIDQIKKMFTIKYVGFNEILTITRNYRIYPEKQTLILPKFGMYECLNDDEKCKPFHSLDIYSFDNVINILASDSIKNTEWTGKLNKFQLLVKNEIMEKYFSHSNVKKGLAGVTLSLPTGHGKTFVAMSLISELKVPTLIICPKRKIVSQWVGLLTNYFPNLKIGIYHSDNKINGDIIVGVIDSLVNNSNFIMKCPINSSKIEYTKKNFYNRWGFIILDESHNYVTKYYSKIFSYISPNYTLGLSATPYNRRDNLDIISHWNIGLVLTSNDIPNYLAVYKKEKTVPVFKGRIIGIKYYGPVDYTKVIHNNNGIIAVHKTVDLIINDPYRIKLIVNKIYELYNKNYCLLIFADRISYLKQIKEKIDNYQPDINQYGKEQHVNSIILDLINKQEHQIITGGATDNEMAHAYLNSKIILTTYAFFMEGISIPRINAILYATPRKSGIKQSNGRCLRPSDNENINKKMEENNKERIILDIIDWNIGFMKSQWYKRKKIYSEMDEIGADFIIMNEDVNYKELMV